MKDKINVDYVTTSQVTTPTAAILVDNAGKNSIVVNFGSMLELTTADIDNAENMFGKSKIFTTSLMLRPEVVLYSLKLAKKHGCIG